ncbi:FAD-dependent thymidylate synthase [Tepidiforma bonchosmolovskayae]|jgi:thymidylate synthase (FAD)|uniref:Flavin-dependent thymidylate synthase n=1 Tax=Tepidiforma bonchosmolovskayae TaxID=2601677 RepID=A0ABX6BYP9_9CHLR|nr:FAD-dependent thymidylate synthase [Tepidiforma bonchosmolovskayae]QFG02002.1 FAD-dependent thymidylate synthase [Tepidiforma bonchosmolovskayae]
MAIAVTLLSHSPDPIRSLYMAYRTCYSSLTPQQVAARIADERISRETMLAFVEERLKTGHTSPLEQVWFEFAISGVSRAFSHQFVRHRVGISFEQQSQRYVTYKGGRFPYTVPETVEKAGLAGEMERLFEEAGALYERMVAAGVPAEDARFLLPNATNTNFKVTVNLQSLLHICDLRLCTRAQWEFRKVAALMRAEVMKVEPVLGRMLQPKCGERRLGYCDEEYEAWEACPIGRVRPHKEVLFKVYESYRRGELQPLRDEDFRTIESAAEPQPDRPPG